MSIEDEDDTFACPSCGEVCHEGDEQCPSCGEVLTEEYSEEENDEYSPSKQTSLYELDEEEEGKLIKVINKCIERIACENDFYDSEALEDEDDILDNIIDNIADNHDSEDIIAFIDTSSSGEAETGLVFTKIGIIEKNNEGKIALPYKKMSDMVMEDGKLIFSNTKGFGSGVQKDGDVYIKETYYDIDVLMRLCERIVNYLQV